MNSKRRNYKKSQSSSFCPRLTKRRSKYQGADWVGRSERLRNERLGKYPELEAEVKKKVFSKKDYVPLDERDDWDGEVQVLKPYKDHEWTGRNFDSRVGKRGKDKKRRGRL